MPPRLSAWHQNLSKVFDDGFEGGDLTAWNEDQDEFAYKYTGHQRELHDNADYMLGRHYLWVVSRFASVDQARDGWNLYSYALGNPLKFVDPSGLTVSLSGFSAEEQQAIVDGLNSFTGNTYSVDENGQLQLVAVGDDSSPTGNEFLHGLIDSEADYRVVRTSGTNQRIAGEPTVAINPESFNQVDYGAVAPETFNLGSTIFHELRHATTNLCDRPGSGNCDDPVRIGGETWTGPIVDFVNQVRSERGLPTRVEYVSPPTRLNGGPAHSTRFKTSRRFLPVRKVVRSNYWSNGS